MHGKYYYFYTVACKDLVIPGAKSLLYPSTACHYLPKKFEKTFNELRPKNQFNLFRYKNTLNNKYVILYRSEGFLNILLLIFIQ